LSNFDYSLKQSDLKLIQAFFAEPDKPFLFNYKKFLIVLEELKEE